MLNTNKIESLINSTSLSNEKVGEIVGVSEHTIRYRKKKKNWLADEVNKLSIHFNKPLTWFFDREETPLPVVNEQHAAYSCPACKEKTMFIAALQQANQLLTEQNRELKNRLGGKHPRK